MNQKLIEMAIQNMDSDEILEKFYKLCQHGSDGDCLIRFLEYLFPLYESSKKAALTEIIRACHRSLIDETWDNPDDNYLHGRLNELKKIAEELDIDIKPKEKDAI